MVVRLTGTVNGWPVEFVRKDGDTWTGTVPGSDTGVWVIALWAEDDAGNTGYYATVRFRYTAKDLGWRIEILGLGAGVRPEEVRALFGVSGPEEAVRADGIHGTAEVTGPDGETAAEQLRTSAEVGGPGSRVGTGDIRSTAGLRETGSRTEPDGIRSRPEDETIREETSA